MKLQFVIARVLKMFCQELSSIERAEPNDAVRFIKLLFKNDAEDADK